MGSSLEDNMKYLHHFQMHQSMNKRLRINVSASFHHKADYRTFQCGLLPDREDINTCVDVDKTFNSCFTLFSVGLEKKLKELKERMNSFLNNK